MADGIDSISTDVLVIGSGAAGLIAAITARQNGSEVVVVSKAMTGGRTATALSDASLTVESPGFSQEAHFNKTMRTGHFLNDPDLVQQIVERGPGVVQWLADEIGVEFEPLIDQGYKPKQGGLELTKKLQAKAEDLGIEKLEHLSLFKLLVYEGHCIGALGITSQGERRAIFSKSTVLATGGFSGIYPRQDNPKGQYGDGLALAMKAGAQVRDLEFVQFLMGIGEEELPTFLVFRPFPKEARLVNDEDEDIIDKYLPGVPLNEAMWSRRDELGRALAMENVEGTTYLDLTSVDWSDADRWFGLRHLSKFKFDYETRPLQVATLAHYTMGGVAIDERGRSSVPGLYAVGEVASGTHGANRHGGNSLMDCLVFGALAGEDVSAADRCSVRLPHELLAHEFARFADAGGTFSTETARQRLHAITDGHLEVLRDERGLYQARCDLRELYRDLCAATTADPKEAVGLIEMEGATLVASAVCEFALARAESRGAHHRKDYPKKSPLWQRSQFGVLQNGQMRLDIF